MLYHVCQYVWAWQSSLRTRFDSWLSVHPSMAEWSKNQVWFLGELMVIFRSVQCGEFLLCILSTDVQTFKITFSNSQTWLDACMYLQPNAVLQFLNFNVTPCICIHLSLCLGKAEWSRNMCVVLGQSSRPFWSCGDSSSVFGWTESRAQAGKVLC